MEQNLIKATRNKWRFSSSKGQLTVEDLWDLPLQSEKGSSLDQIAQSIHKEVMAASTPSFVSARTPEQNEWQNKLDLVVAIISIRQAENLSKMEARERAEKKSMLLDILERKKTEAYQGMTEEELIAQIQKL